MNLITRWSPNCNPRMPRDDVRLLILHATVGSLMGSLSWLRNPQSKVSSHYLMGKLGTCYQLVKEDWIAWHGGAGHWGDVRNLNAHSIGIELENLTGAKGFAGQDPWPAAQLDAAADLVADILHRHQLPPSAIVTHSMVAEPGGRKTDPSGFPIGSLRVRLGGQAPLYRVLENATYVRQGPGQKFTPAGQMQRGELFALGAICLGTPPAGSSDARWAWRMDGLGFTHMSCLEPLL